MDNTRKLLKCPKNQISLIKSELSEFDNHYIYDCIYDNLIGKQCKYNRYSFLNNMYMICEDNLTLSFEIVTKLYELRRYVEKTEFYELLHNINMSINDLDYAIRRESDFNEDIEMQIKNKMDKYNVDSN